MEDLKIRRNRSFPVVPYQNVGKTEKQAGSGRTQKTAGTTAFTVSDTLRKLMEQTGQAAGSSRESQKLLQMGKAVLAEVQDSLDRIAELAQKAAGGGEADHAALQEELERVLNEIDRIIGSAVPGGTKLFQDGDAGGVQTMPDWLLKGLALNAPSAEQLLAGLGLDKSATGAELLAAIADRPLESSSAAGYLAALYLGAVIAGGTSAGAADLGGAMEGLRQLLDMVAEGVPLDQAIELLTKGMFTSLSDFQSQFTGGTAPGLQEFLVNLLLSDSGSVLLSSPLMDLLAGLEGMNLDLLMGLVAAPSHPEAAQEQAAADNSLSGGAGAGQAEGAGGAVEQTASLRLGNVQVTGRDLSGVSFDPSTGELAVSGPADVTLQGTEEEIQSVRIAGSGTVTLQNVKASVLTVGAGTARIFSAGESVLAQVRLQTGTSLTFGGNGVLRTGAFLADETNTLRLTGGAVIVAEKKEGAEEALGVLKLPVLVDGPASLAARAGRVTAGNGKPLEAFDVVWKTLLPSWSGITAMALDGRPVRMGLADGILPSLVRLWLDKGDPSHHGYPAHTLLLQGRDGAGRPKARYAYLHWNQYAGAFEEVPMYPNPFTVTGGEPGLDWVYEEGSHTLHILSGQVTAVSGGSGTDANQVPFSGRIALADSIGAMELTLNGVTCRVSSGRAFRLGRENKVTLLVENGTENLFESGAGCAGISLGDGSSLRIDHTQPPRKGGNPPGTLTATIGAGIGGGDGDVLITESDRIVNLLDGSSGTDLQNAQRWAREGISLKIGNETVKLPQFRLSSRALRLNTLSLSSRESAQAAGAILDADRRWVSQLQTVYAALYGQVKQSFRSLPGDRRYTSAIPSVMRDNARAAALLEGQCAQLKRGKV